MPCLRDREQQFPSVVLPVVPTPGHRSCGFSHHTSPCSPGEGAHLGTLKASAIAEEAGGGQGRCLPCHVLWGNRKWRQPFFLSDLLSVSSP